MDNYQLALWLLIWIVAAGFIVFSRWKVRTRRAGLVPAYLLNLWLIHWPAAAIYLFSWYSNHDPEEILSGVQESTYAVLAFGVGVLLAPSLTRALRFPPPASATRIPVVALAPIYLGIGLVCYLVLLPLFAGLPTIAALITAGWNLTIVGLVLLCWKARQDRRWGAFGIAMSAAVALPFLTIAIQGFIGQGIAALFVVTAFVAGFIRVRWRVVAAVMLLGYVGLSFYVTYMRDRGAIRDVVWREATLTARGQSVYQSFTDLEWFDYHNEFHLGRIDDRLNQNHLLGASKAYLASGNEDFARGRTIWEALISLVPRAFWPDKPVFAGGGDLAARYTGLRFAEGTSIGLGQTMEFYINFGTWGVVIGFLVLGAIVSTLDKAAGERLAKGDWQGFALWFLPGLAFLIVGGSLVEVISSAGAAMVTVFSVNTYLLPHLRGKKVAPAPAGSLAPLTAEQSPMGKRRPSAER